ncbi:MAG: LysR family transcriptional regulator [Desulfitibacter sp. BRH_c19]|nr:MAG: LysR family transcriptional regulator [Desulfitibacter sp. BRH_c19]
MNINHLKYFLAVAKSQSFTKAAQNIHISQPSISKMIRDMEEEMGVLLFHRDRKQVILTDAGQAVYQQTQEIITSFDNLTTTLSDIINLKKGSIKIGIPPIVGASFFPKTIGDFIQSYPTIELELMEVGSKKIETAVETGDVDVGIICSAPAQPEAFEITPLISDPLMVVFYPEHPMSKRNKISLKDLKDEKFVLFGEDFSLHDHIINCCRSAGFLPQIVCRSSQRDFMVEMVVAKLGIALLPQKICQELNPKKIVALPITDQSIFLNLMIICKKGKYLSFAVREWLSFTTSRLSKT